MTYAELILPLPLKRLFTYAVPETFARDIAVGMRAIVNFGARKLYTGIVYRLTDRCDMPEESVKPISLLIDTAPIVTDAQLRLWRTVADYYCCPLGEVYKAAVPGGLRLESESVIIRNNGEDTETESGLTRNEMKILDSVSDGKPHTINEITTNTGIKNPLPAIGRLIEKNSVRMKELLADGYKPKYTEHVRLHERLASDGTALSDAIDSLGRAKRQQHLLMTFVEIAEERHTSYGETQITKKELLDRADCTSAVYNQLVEKEMLRPVTVRTDRIDYGKATEGFHTLTEAQAAAYAKITDELESGKQTVLLHGVASSGKTEIYIQLIRKTIAEGKTALMLVPEISLTTQLAQRLRRVFGARLGVFHSRHSDHERVEVWNDMLRNRRFDVVLGTRASVFLPFHDLGLVIVDEEDDSGYKQSDPAPRYNGKHVALMLARQCGCPTLLGSATPSVETYSNCLTKRYGYAALPERYGSIDPPEMKIIDMREAYRKRMLRGHFTYPLINAIREALGQGEQVILFQNRRGYATFVECTQCAYVPRCPNCDVSLTYHKAFNKLTCHYCGHTIPMPSVCPECGCDRLDTRGFGTEQVEDEAAALFPEARTARMDLDTTRGKESFNRLLTSFENKEIDILIGTQMITKGLDFANVGLVGILNADNLMNYPDFRAHERAFQMLVQVGGRAGRTMRRGKVLIQTSSADHPLMQQIVRNDYWTFFSQQMAEREAFRYPPYFRLIRLTVKHRDQHKLDAATALFADALRKSFGARVLGPDTPAVGKIQNLYIKHILLKIENSAPIDRAKRILMDIAGQVTSCREYKPLIINVDVDPM